jgi:TorA maturation chaperone TorD
MSDESEHLLERFCDAAAADIGLLILLHDKEPDSELLKVLKAAGYPATFGLALENERSRDALAFARQVTDALEVTDASIDDLAADYAAIYLNHAIQASPMESVWIDEEGLTHQEPMFQVREYYREQQLQAEDWRVRSDDHLVMQMRFIRHLFMQEELAIAARFLDEHLLRWLGSFAERVATRCATPWFAAAALVTHAWFEEFRDLLAGILDEPRPTPEEIDKRMRPKPQVVEMPLQYMPGTGPAV